jgi:uncharacterized membrane protein
MKNKGMLIATAAAALILTGGVVAMSADEKAGGDVKCTGINACKGHGSCAGAGNECKGKNGCKGKGVSMVKSTDDCTKQGGKVIQ